MHATYYQIYSKAGNREGATCSCLMEKEKFQTQPVPVLPPVFECTR
jgi:hypothetical protein